MILPLAVSVFDDEIAWALQPPLVDHALFSFAFQKKKVQHKTIIYLNYFNFSVITLQSPQNKQKLKLLLLFSHLLFSLAPSPSSKALAPLFSSLHSGLTASQILFLPFWCGEDKKVVLLCYLLREKNSNITVIFMGFEGRAALTSKTFSSITALSALERKVSNFKSNNYSNKQHTPCLHQVSLTLARLCFCRCGYGPFYYSFTLPLTSTTSLSLTKLLLTTLTSPR